MTTDTGQRNSGSKSAKRLTYHVLQEALCGNWHEFEVALGHIQRMIQYIIPDKGFYFLTGEDVEDIAQESWARIFGGLRAVKDKSSVAAWAFTLVRNTVIDHLRANGKTTLSLEDIEGLEFLRDSGLLPDEEVEQVELERDIEERICGMPKKKRRVAKAVLKNPHATFPDLGQMLDMKPDAVRMTLRRMRPYFKDCLSRHNLSYLHQSLRD